MSDSAHLRPARIGIVVTSDRASAGVYQDLGGPAIRDTMRAYLRSPWSDVYRLIADDQPTIEQTLICQRMLPGFGELMRAASLRFVPTAILSRQTAGIRGQSLIINLPGKPKSIRECLDAVFPAVPFCLDLIGAARLETDAAVIKSFRPKAG